MIDKCGETIQKWRRMTGAFTIVALKAVYLQINYEISVGIA